MGYEVLDASDHGVADPVGAPPVADDVVDLDALPDLGASPGRPTRARARPGPALVVVAALVAGALAGAGISRHRNDQAAERSDRAAVTVAAQASAIEPFTLPIGIGAQLQVTVTNLGPLAVEVIASDRTRSDTDQGTTRQAVVTVLGARTSVGPGTSVSVEMRLPVDCRAGRLITTTLPVRTADGARHTVPVSLPDDGRPPASICPPLGSASQLQAQLTGTVVQPVLQLTNNTSEAMRVRLPAQGLTPQGSDAVIQVITRPSLPTTIRPHDRLTVRLRFVAHSCVRELQDLQRLDIATLSVAPETLTATRVVPGEPVPVDVTAVVAAAMVRTCG